MHDSRTVRRWLPILLLCALIPFLAAVPGRAATVLVTTTTDEADGSCGDGDCSLRDALATAVAGDEVQVPAGNFLLSLGQLVVNKSLTVRGAGARNTVVDANLASRVFFVSAGGVEISDLTVTRGSNSGDGGGIACFGSLTVRRCTVSNSRADRGGGIGGEAALTVDRCTLTGNSAGSDGGGIYTGFSPVTIVNSTISGNTGGGYGGGVEKPEGHLSVVNSTITGNSAPFGGGGIDLDGGTFSLFNSIVAGNFGRDCFFYNAPSELRSLDGDGSCGVDLPNMDPLLGPLADNGGPTDTHALLAGSPAIDSADDATCAGPPVNGIDQRGTGRPQGAHCDIGAFEVAVTNQPPACAAASPSVATLWPPNHQMAQVSIQGVTDPEGDPVSIEIDQIRQDEPTQGLGDGNTCPDSQGIGSATASVRAERSALANGRVYTISFTASDEEGGTCQGSVKVCVPRNNQGGCVDGGPTVDSSACGGGSFQAPSAFHTHPKATGPLGLLCFSHAPSLSCDLLCDAGALLCV